MKYRSAFENEYTKREQLVNVSGSGIQSVMVEHTQWDTICDGGAQAVGYSS